MPMSIVLAGSLLLALFLAFAPRMPTQGNLLAAVLIVVFGFFFVTVSSRITGLIGSSSNPVSGMTIATLILTCLLFVSLGWTGSYYAPIALCVGAVVCIAAANGGATSQDLKTGYIVGATPLYQQIGLVIGVVASALVIGMTTLVPPPRVRHRLARDRRAAGDPDGHDHPRASSSQSLPWGLVLVGVFSRRDARALRHPFAVVRRGRLPADRDDRADHGGRRRPLVREQARGGAEESEIGAGTLFSSGLIAGGSLAGILYAVLVGTGTIGSLAAIGRAAPFLHEGTSGLIASSLLFVALAVILAAAARRRLT